MTVSRLFPEDPPPCARRWGWLIRAITLLLLAYAGHAADAGQETRYAIDDHHSWVRIYVYRGGMLSFLGHDHLISSDTMIGGLTYTPPPALAATFKLEVPVEALVVDDPQVRKLVGGKFAGVVADKDREGTRRNMLSEKVLDAAHYPKIEISGDWVSGRPSQGTVAATIAVRDTRHRYTLPVDIARQDDRLVVTGSFQILQTELGITPLNLFGGLLAVADRVDVEFTLVFTPAGGGNG